jgi:hypothetical protein
MSVLALRRTASLDRLLTACGDAGRRAFGDALDAIPVLPPFVLYRTTAGDDPLRTSPVASPDDRPLTRYEKAHRDQLLASRGFLPDGTPIRDDPDYSLILHDRGYGGPRGDVA